MLEGAYDFHLFDLDGTLVDAEWEYTRGVFDRVGDRIGRSFSDERVRTLWHGLSGSRNETLRAWGIDPAEFWPAFHAAENPLERAESTYLHPDAERVLATLDGPTGLITHCQSFLTEPVLDRLDLHDYFDTVVCCDEEIGWKPDPDPLRMAMADLGVDPKAERGYYAGDGEADVGAAWNAGIDAVHVERLGHDKRGRCVLGDYRVDRLDELLESDGPLDQGGCLEETKRADAAVGLK
ncbi:HAD family hydrolase [Halopenitus sp. H-Gu1]|uniref:HAD family hydrolase n=1 Tax=Halopenitus sp. H-Gu1 TaxID=3242697 RepID=UPI00359CE7B3